MRETNMTDSRLIELFFARDERAIAETDRKYGKMLFGVAYNILRDRSDAQECQNDAYLGAWNAIPPARPQSLRAFLAQIIRRLSINRYRERSAQKRIPTALTVSCEELFSALNGELSLSEDVACIELGRLIDEYVNGLSERERFLFIGRFYMSESVKSLAVQLSVSARSVYRELDNIKQSLKRYLEENEVYI